MDTKDTLILSLHGEGKGLREIAEAVNISHVAVKKRLDRGDTEKIPFRFSRKNQNPTPGNLEGTVPSGSNNSGINALASASVFIDRLL